jgi:hypothetical protein
MDTLKAEQITGSKWRVLAIPFAGPFKGKDLDGEYFDRDTDIKPHWFKARPVMFQHGQDITAKDEDYGEQELDANPEDEGWWGTVWLNRSARYWAEVDRMLRAGKMYGSSGAIAHLVRKDHKTGHIEVWPHAEQTLTPTPANPYARITAAKAIEGFNTAGIALDDPMRAVLSDLDRTSAADLPTDLPGPAQAAMGGDEAARLRLEGELSRLQTLLKTLSR